MTIEEQVKGILKNRLGVSDEKLVAGAKLVDDLGADSLDAAELVLDFEDEFDLKIPDEDAEKLTRVGAIVSYLTARVGERPPGGSSKVA